MSPPPSVASIAVGIEKRAIANPSWAGVEDRSFPSVAMKGTTMPTGIMLRTAGR
jgi:hypothetical protein